MNADYVKGFRDAVEKCKGAVSAVPVETYPAHDPFSQTEQTPSARLGRDVKDDCVRAVSGVKP